LTTTRPASVGPLVGETRPPVRPPRFLMRPALLAVFLAAATAAQLLRTPGVSAWRSLEAEDGGIFYTDALNDPLVRTIGRAYEGYLHVVPRLLAAVASLFPVRDAAVLLNGSAALVVALLAAYVWSAARRVLPSAWGRSLLILLMLLLPAAGWEVNATVNNLHWYLDFAVLWVFIGRPRSAWGTGAGVVVAAAAALSDPLAALVLPLAGYRLLQAFRSRPVHVGALLAPVVFVVGLALQAVYGVAEKTPNAFVQRDWRDLPGTYGLRVVGTLLIGDRFLPGLFTRHGLLFADACLVVGLVAAAAALAVGRQQRRDVVVLLGYSAAFLVVPLMIRGTSIYLDRAHVTLNGSRYMLVPALTLAAALLVALFRPREDPHRRPVPEMVVTVLVVAVVAGSYSMTSFRSRGPEWSTGLHAAEQRCRERGGDPPGSGRSARNPWATVVGPGQVFIPGSPGRGNRSAWNVVVDCSRLDLRS
jgi:hypothetical protein